MPRTALITGITGQDGAYLAELLLAKGYVVYGAYRRTSSLNFWRLKELDIQNHENLKLVEFDLTDPGGCLSLVQRVQPNEIYNLAAQSFVGVSFSQPSATSQITGIGTLNLLEAIRITNKKIRFYQASTSEMFGKVQAIPQSETTAFHPRSPYGVAKLYAHWMTVNYRETYDIFASSGILFNHESPLRGREFVTRKISEAFARISIGEGDVLKLGNLNALRDWGFARDYVEGMWLMLQAEQPDTYILATNRTENVRTFVRLAANVIGMDIQFIGCGDDEIAIDNVSGKTVVSIDPNLYRPAEVDLLIGDFAKAAQNLNWRPKTSLEELCVMMVEADILRLKNKFIF
jgi:GDPmannose 4,6-dehydratase